MCSWLLCTADRELRPPGGPARLRVSAAQPAACAGIGDEVASVLARADSLAIASHRIHVRALEIRRAPAVIYKWQGGASLARATQLLARSGTLPWARRRLLAGVNVLNTGPLKGPADFNYNLIGLGALNWG